MITVIEYTWARFIFDAFFCVSMPLLFLRCLQVMGRQHRDNQKLAKRLNGMHIHRDALKRRNAQLEAAWVWDAGEPAPPIAGWMDEN